MNTAAEANRRILVIDDNRAIHEDFIKILGDARAEGPGLEEAEAFLFGESESPVTAACFEIDSAYQGQQGLALVVAARKEGRPYALAFVDVRMPPGWDGVETAKNLWRVEPDLQVVICTAYSDYSWENMIRELGVSDRLLVLKKPFDTVEVFQLAHALTEKWRLLQVAKLQLEGLEQRVTEKTHALLATNVELRQQVQERSAAEEALRATQARLEHLLAHSPVVIYSEEVRGTEWIPSWISDNIQNMLGWSAEEWRGPDWLADHLEPTEKSALIDTRRRLLEEGTSPIEYRLRHADGRYCWIHDERKLMRDEDGVPVQVVGAWTDITQRRQLEEQLRESQKMEAIGQLAGGVAHDFNNLLSVIDGYTDILLNDETLDSEVADSIREIAGAAGRAGTLTRQLLAYGRRQIMDAKEVDLNDVVRGFSKMYQPILREGIRLRIKTATQPLTGLIDRSMIEQVLLNLAVNARDAMPKGGDLVIGVSARKITEADLSDHQQARIGLFICLQVSDTGLGIAPEVVQRMFEPFFTTKEMGRGTGLGLAMVYGIVRQHYGWIEVDTRSGRGSTFTVFLPSDAPEMGAPAFESLVGEVSDRGAA